MPELKTGKKIYELDRLESKVKDDTWFAVSDNSLTKRVNFAALKEYINGDNLEPSDTLYYSTQKITDLLGDASDRMNKIENDIDVTNINLTELAKTVVNNYDTLDRRITNEVNTLNARITNEVSILNGKISDEAAARIAGDNALQSQINTINTTINNLNNRITSLESRPTIYCGNSAPNTSTAGRNGDIYIQYY